MRFDLRPYQIESVEALRENLRKGITRQILCSPTGSGKTEIAMHIVEESAKKGKRCYFICDRQSLVLQTSARFHDNGIVHGVLMGTQSSATWRNTMIMSAQTLESRGFKFKYPSESTFGRWIEAPDPDLVIDDECHDIRKKIISYLVERGICTIGLSATPFSAGLHQIYDAVVNVTTTSKLLAEQYLAKVNVVSANVQANVENLALRNNGEWAKEDVSGRVMRIIGEVVPEWERRTAEYFGGPKPTIAFCPSVIDSMDLAEKFQARGYDFRTVHYRQSSELNQEIINCYKRGGCLGLISCIALTKGFDAPATQVMIDCYPLRKSFTLHIQKIGRVMRIADGKDDSLIIDHAGNWLGFLEDTHAFFDLGCPDLSNEKLHKTTRKKIKTGVHDCKNCGFIFPPVTREQPALSECPSCGTARKRPRGRMQTIHGELEQVDVVDGKGRALPFQGDWWEQICAVASRMATDDTKAKRIALAKYHSIFGRWPGGRKFVRTDIEVDESVERYLHRQFQRWLISKRKRAA